ncbi:hypothetical protein SRABI128_00541 [Microbacterium sp. Bi128]|nr:hypothetical protein SRABI128_00541 [Microbacterium sp. Bi128]
MVGRALVTQHDRAARVRLRLDDDVGVREAARAGQTHDDRLVELAVRRDPQQRGLGLVSPGERGGDVLGTEVLATRCLAVPQPQLLDGVRGVDLDADDALGPRLVDEQRRQTVDGAQLPVDLTAAGGAEIGRVERGRTLRPGLHGNHGCHEGGRVDVTLRGDSGGLGRGRHQPTDPSMPISMSLFSSRAYSMGSSRAIGSMKPRTIIAIASSSGRPRDCR